MGAEEVKEELKGSLGKILQYAGCDAELENDFRAHLSAYGKLSDKSGREEQTVRLRRKVTELFYKVYKAAFQAAIKEGNMPAVVSMFLNFGYVDEQLAGAENAMYLYLLAQHLPTDPKRGVYTFFQWLMAIYMGKKEPCRNEMDLDFREYLREQKKMGRITSQQERELLENGISRVMFEIENVFPPVNRLTFGQPSVFCPVFSKHNVYRPLNTDLVTADKVMAEIEEIRSKDFKAFYRENLLSLPGRKLTERIEVEVLPDIILLPNVGSRSILWQEIEGKKRTTPARMMCSVFHTSDLSQSILHMTGEFRWEMCKRDQGGRWNNIADPSLTSEYYDYIQFYRKNKELSAEVRERIKAQLAKARNNYKEMFVTDYMQWIRYESGGLPRLNRAVRNIMFAYCPFPKEIRDKIGKNPLFKQAADRYNIKNGQTLHRITLLCKKLENTPEGVPQEIAAYKEYLES